jgi:uncharacterized protein
MTDRGKTDGKTLYGVVHLPPLPGTPFYANGSLPRIINDAVHAASAMQDGGADGVLLQTVDRVYSVADEADPARIAAMTLCAKAVIDAVGEGFDVGVQIMRHAVSASLAIAKIVGATFVRADAIVGATMSTHGLVRPDPLQIMTYRRSIDAFDVQLIVDIDSMHFQWEGPAERTSGVARRAILVGADAVCVANPDDDLSIEKLTDVRKTSPSSRIFVGGFVTHTNAERLLAAADGAFVSGCLMEVKNPTQVDRQRVRQLADIFHGCAQ